jgi:hypothetical protein
MATCRALLAAPTPNYEAGAACPNAAHRGSLCRIHAYAALPEPDVSALIIRALYVDNAKGGNGMTEDRLLTAVTVSESCERLVRGGGVFAVIDENGEMHMVAADILDPESAEEQLAAHADWTFPWQVAQEADDDQEDEEADDDQEDEEADSDQEDEEAASDQEDEEAASDQDEADDDQEDEDADSDQDEADDDQEDEDADSDQDEEAASDQDGDAADSLQPQDLLSIIFVDTHSFPPSYMQLVEVHDVDETDSDQDGDETDQDGDEADHD